MESTAPALSHREQRFLKRLYYDLDSPVAFSTAPNMFSVAKKFIKHLRLKHVKEWLSKQKTYLKHRRRKKSFRRRKIITGGLHQNHQADLMDCSRLAPYNSGVRFLLVNIDCFSRYAQAVCLKRKLGSHVAEAFEKLYRREKKIPQRLQTDEGTEFLNTETRAVFRKHNIHHYYTHSPMKAAIIERFIRSIRMIMAKFLHARKTRRYVDDLDNLITIYNNRKHRSLFKLAPTEVTPDNERELWKKMYADQFPRKTSFKFHLDQLVKISRRKSLFEKEWTGLWSEENFRIVVRRATNPPTYKLVNRNDDRIPGSYYEDEMIPVKEDNKHR